MAGVKKNKTNLNIIDYSPQLFVAVAVSRTERADLKGEKVFVLARFVVVVVVGEEALIAANPTQPNPTTVMTLKMPPGPKSPFSVGSLRERALIRISRRRPRVPPAVAARPRPDPVIHRWMQLQRRIFTQRMPKLGQLSHNCLHAASSSFLRPSLHPKPTAF